MHRKGPNRMQRALLTGATGFLGSYVLENLLQAGMQVRCLVRDLERSETLQQPGVERFLGDLSDPQALGHAVRNVDLVIHLGGLMTALSSQTFEKINGTGTESLARACAEITSPPILIFVSSIAAAGTAIDGHPRSEADGVRPVSHYGRSKRSGELAAASFADRVPTTILRPPFVFGGGDRSGFYLFRPVKRFGIHPVPGMRHRRKISLVHAKDLADGIMLVSDRGTRVDVRDATEESFRQGCYFVCDDATPRYSQLGDMIGKAMGKDQVVKLPVPDMIACTAGGMASVLARLRGRASVFSLDKVREGVAGSWICSAERIKQELGFKPAASLEQRIQETVDWYSERGWF